MEFIYSQIDRIEDLLAKMDEVIDLARSVPFSSKISIEKDALYSVIDDVRAIVYDMRKGLPVEINNARKALSERDKLDSDARSKADMILKAAESEANKMLNEHDITLQAKQEAGQIEETAHREAREFKIAAGQYVKDVLEDLDEMLRKTLEEQLSKSREMEEYYSTVIEELYHNRKSIRIEGE